MTECTSCLPEARHTSTTRNATTTPDHCHRGPKHMNRCDNAWLIILPVKECFSQILQEGESYRAAPNLESPDPDRDCELLESLLYELIVLRQGILSAFIRSHTRLSPVDSRHEKEWLEQLGNGGTVRIETFRHGESDVGLVFEITDVN